MKLGTTTQSRHADLVLQDVVTSHPCRTLPTGFLLPSLFLSCSAAQGGQVGKAVAQHQTLNQGAAAPDTHNAAPTKQNIYIYIYGTHARWERGLAFLPTPTNREHRYPSSITSLPKKLARLSFQWLLCSQLPTRHIPVVAPTSLLGLICHGWCSKRPVAPRRAFIQLARPYFCMHGAGPLKTT